MRDDLNMDPSASNQQSQALAHLAVYDPCLAKLNKQILVFLLHYLSSSLQK